LTAGAATPRLPGDVRTIHEEEWDGEVPLHLHAEWREDLPWLVQGTTGRGADGFDLGLFGDTPVGVALARWRALREAAAMPSAVHSRQVHGRELMEHAARAPGLSVADGFDGHLTAAPGILLTVSVADCVPVSLVDPDRRRVALLHAGWRGAASGILAAGLARLGSSAARLRVHLGPAICGQCYEVGPEVHQALGLPPPPSPAPVDVRAALARQAVAAGIAPDHVTVSGHCTRCGPGFYSHRAGSAERQLGLLGIRP
jgi:polyphenol oxidase